MPAEATLKQAKDKLREIEDSIVKGVYLPAKQVPIFKDVAEAWLSHKKSNVRGNTMTMYDGHVKNHFGTVNTIRINRITVATVERFISEHRENGVTIPTLKKILITFGQVMKYAIRHRYIDHNPVTEAERPKRGKGEEESPVIRVLKPAEIGKLLEATKDPGHEDAVLACRDERGPAGRAFRAEMVKYAMGEQADSYSAHA